MLQRQYKISGISLCAIAATFAGGITVAAAQTTDDSDMPGRAMAGTDVAKDAGYSKWDIQLLYGNGFREPRNPDDVAKALVTLENSSAWSWGSSYFYVDLLRSGSNDRDAWDGYAEWYPSASVSKISGKDLSIGFVRDMRLTAGINAGRKSTGANPLVFLPGVAFDLALPRFTFFSLGLYAYVDRGTVNNGASNGCHETGFQITPSWLLPFSIGSARLRFDGFLDYVSAHGACAARIGTQPRLTLDAGRYWGVPDKLFVGIEYQYTHNKFGRSHLTESFPQALVMYRF
jgi:nucleoside-specific outer membrane channel protein Tsx